MTPISPQVRDGLQSLARPIRHMADRRLDFPKQVPLRQSYIVASSPRSGSTFFCKELWQTGVLGAPTEYVNYRNRPTAKMIGYRMVERLKAATPAEYFSKLLACRTSRNGIFGLKTHFEHFEAAYEAYPEMLSVLAPVTFIYIERKNLVAQAVSLAKALQTDTWTSLNDRKVGTLKYDRNLISKCIVRIEQQSRAWRRWFERNRIDPYIVTYEELVADKEGIIRKVIELLGAENDEPEEVLVPTIEKESDGTNKEWIARFEEETKAGVAAWRSDAPDSAPVIAQDRAEPIAPEPAAPPAPAGHFFDRFGRFGDATPADAAGPLGFVGTMRSRHRYDAIVASNLELFNAARVLDIASADGLWSMAALDAGAAHVVGIEPDSSRVAMATKTFAEYKIKPSTYRFINSDVLAALRALKAETFDLVLCREFLAVCDPRLVFSHLRDLRPRHVILDISIVAGKGPIARFGTRDESDPGAGGRSGPILSIPNHELIAYLCDYYDFGWRLVDWHSLGITDWSSVRDYERDRHRTYVLERRS